MDDATILPDRNQGYRMFLFSSFYVSFDHISINFCSVANPPSLLPTVATRMDDLDNHASVHGGSSGDAKVSKEVPANLKHLPPSRQFCQTNETLETGGTTLYPVLSESVEFDGTGCPISCDEICIVHTFINIVSVLMLFNGSFCVVY